MKNLILILFALCFAAPTFANDFMKGRSLIISSSSVTSSGGVTTLTATSNNFLIITGTLTHTVRLPAANDVNVALDRTFAIANDSTGSLTIEDGAGGTVAVLLAGQDCVFKILDKATVAGTWTFLTGVTNPEVDPFFVADGMRHDGTITGTGNFDFGGFTAGGIADPVNPQDAVTKNHLDGLNFLDETASDLLYLRLNAANDPMTAELDMGTNKISGVTVIENSVMNQLILEPSGDLTLGGPAAQTIMKEDDAASDAVKAPSFFLKSAAKIMGTGDSGDLVYQIGASAGGAKGSHNFSNDALINIGSIDGAPFIGPTSGPNSTISIGPSNGTLTGVSNTLINAHPAYTTQTRSVAIGVNAASGDDSVSVGYVTGSFGSVESVYLGPRCGQGFTGDENIIIAGGCTTNPLPSQATSNSMALGSNQAPIFDAYFGQGHEIASPQPLDFHLTNGVGTDVSGAAWTFNGSQGTGTGLGGSFIYRTAPSTGTSAVVNPLVTRMEIDGEGVIDFTGATGFVGLPAETDPLSLHINGDNAMAANLDMAGNDLVSSTQFAVITNSNTNITFNTDGSSNIDGADFVGPTSGPANTLIIGNVSATMTGAFNTAVGRGSGDALTSGIKNTMLGAGSGSALTSGSTNVLLGNDAGKSLTTQTNVIAIGDGAFGGGSTGTQTIAIGGVSGLGSTSDNSIYIGRLTGRLASGDNNIVMSGNAVAADFYGMPALNSSNRLSFGSSSAPLVFGYFGEGAVSATPGDFSFNGTSGRGADVNAGAFFDFNGGAGTSLGTGSHIRFRTAPPVGPSGSVLNPLVTRMEIEDDGRMAFNTSQMILNVDGSAQIDGADFVGPTSGPAGTIYIGDSPPAITGINNTAFGIGAGDSVTSAIGGTFVGNGSGTAVTSGNNNTALGYLSFNLLNSGLNNTGLGTRAANNVQISNGSVYVGAHAGINSNENTNSTLIGFGSGQGDFLSDAKYTRTILIGANVAHQLNPLPVGDITDSIAIGSGNQLGNGAKFNTGLNEMIIGSSTSVISNVYIGEGGFSPTPSPLTIQGTVAFGTDVAAANVTYASGAGTGLGEGGHVIFATAPADIATGSVVNPLVTRMEIEDDGTIDLKDNTVIGAAGIPFPAETDPLSLHINGDNAMAANLDMAGNDLVSSTQFAVITNSLTNITFNTDGSSNIDGADFVGPTSGTTDSIYFGSAPPAMTGSSNTAFGVSAGDSVTSGIVNTFMGLNAGTSVTTADGIVAIGNGALSAASTNSANVSIGHNSFLALTSGIENVAVGNKAAPMATSNRTVYLGADSGLNSNSNIDSVLIGHQSGRADFLNDATFTRTILIGAYATHNLNPLPVGAITDSIAIGSGAALGSGARFVTGSNELVIGSVSSVISNVYIGEGGISATPSAVTIQGTVGNGADIAAADVTYAAGAGTGLGEGGHVIFATAPADIATGSVVNPLVTRMEIFDDGGMNLDGAHFIGPDSGPGGSLVIGTNPSAMTGINNTILGVTAGANLTTTGGLVAIGYAALGSGLAPLQATAVGQNAGKALTTGSDLNAFFGSRSGENVTTGDANTYAGANSGFGQVTSSNNTGVGTSVLQGNLNPDNSAFGAEAGTSSTGRRNIFVGRRAGRSTTGDSLIILAMDYFIGGNIYTSIPSASNEFIVGSRASPITSMYIGEAANSTSPGNILISGTRGEGPDVSAGNMTMAPGAGTGVGLGGHFIVQTAPPTGTSSTINPLVTRMEIFDDGGMNLDGAHFIGPTSGPTDTMVFGSNPTLMTGVENVGFGFNSLVAMTTGTRNTGFGDDTLDGMTTGLDNTAIGNSALGQNIQIPNGSGNTAIGAKAMLRGTGSNNTAVGARTLELSTGSNNIAVGLNAGNAVTGSGNILIGHNTNSVFPALSSLAVSNEMVIGTETSKIANIFIGKGAQAGTPTLVAINATRGKGLNVSATDFWIVGGAGTGTGLGGHLVFKTAPATGSSSTVNPLVTRMEIFDDGGMTIDGADFYFDSLPGLTNLFIGDAPAAVTGNDNTAVGTFSGDSLTSGYANTLLGDTSGSTLTVGNNNTLIGHFAGASMTSTVGSVALGASALSGATSVSGTIAIGNSSGLSSTSDKSIFIGSQTGRTVTGNFNIILSGEGVGGDFRGLTSLSATNELSFGSDIAPLIDGYFGEGAVSASPQSFSFNATGGRGSDISAGAFVDFNGGKGTGLGTGSHIRFRTAPASGGTGSVLNGLVTRMEIEDDGTVNFAGASTINAGTNKITDVIDGVAAQDAVTVSQMNTAVASAVASAAPFTTSTVSTTDGIVTELFTVAMDDDSSYICEATVTAFSTNTVNQATYKVTVGAFRRAAGACTIQGTSLSEFEEESNTFWDSDWVCDTNSLDLSITGALGQDVNWKSVTKCEKVS